MSTANSILRRRRLSKLDRCSGNLYTCASRSREPQPQNYDYVTQSETAAALARPSKVRQLPTASNQSKAVIMLKKERHVQYRCYGRSGLPPQVAELLSSRLLTARHPRSDGGRPVGPGQAPSPAPRPGRHRAQFRPGQH